MENMKIHQTVLGWILSPDLALLAQPSIQGVRANPLQQCCGARPRRGHRAQHTLGGVLADGPA
jgi:hypothetical protein